MKKKYRKKKIEEKEKVSRQNNKNENRNNKKTFPGLSGSGDPQLQNMIGKISQDAKTNDLQRNIWRHLERKK